MFSDEGKLAYLKVSIGPATAEEEQRAASANEKRSPDRMLKIWGIMKGVK
jgi:hypothetical protein